MFSQEDVLSTKLIEAFYIIFYRQSHHADHLSTPKQEMRHYLLQLFIRHLEQLEREIDNGQHDVSVVFLTASSSNLSVVHNRLKTCIQLLKGWDNHLQTQESLRLQSDDSKKRQELEELATSYADEVANLADGAYIILPINEQNLIISRQSGYYHLVICKSHNNFYHQINYNVTLSKHAAILKIKNIDASKLNADWFRLFAYSNVYSAFDDDKLYRLFRILNGNPVVLAENMPYFKQQHFDLTPTQKHNTHIRGRCSSTFHLWHLIKYTFEVIFNDPDDPNLQSARSANRDRYYRIIYDFETRLFFQLTDAIRKQYPADQAYFAQCDNDPLMMSQLRFVILEGSAYLGREIAGSDVLRHSHANICKQLDSRLTQVQQWLSASKKASYHQRQARYRFAITQTQQARLPKKTTAQINEYFSGSSSHPTRQTSYYPLITIQSGDDRLLTLKRFKTDFLDKFQIDNHVDISLLQRFRFGIEDFVLQMLQQWRFDGWKKTGIKEDDYARYAHDCADLMWTLARSYQKSYEQLMQRQREQTYDPRQYAHRLIVLYAIAAFVDNLARQQAKFIAAGFAQYRLSTAYYSHLNWADVSKTLVIMQRRWIPAINLINRYFKQQDSLRPLFCFDEIGYEYDGYSCSRPSHDRDDAEQRTKALDYPYQSNEQAVITYNFAINLLRQYPNNYPAFYRAMGWCDPCADAKDGLCQKTNPCKPLSIDDASTGGSKYFHFVYRRNENILPGLFYRLADCILLANSSLVGTGLSKNIELGNLVDQRHYEASLTSKTYSSPYLWRVNGYILSDINYHMQGQLTDEQIQLRAWQRLIYVRSQHTALSHTLNAVKDAITLRGSIDSLSENKLLASQTKQPRDTNRLQYCGYGFIRSNPLLQLEHVYLALHNKQLSFESEPHLMLILQAVFEVIEVAHSTEESQVMSLLTRTMQQAGLTQAWITYLQDYAQFLKQRPNDYRLFFNVFLLINGLYQFCPLENEKTALKKIIEDIRNQLHTWVEEDSNSDVARKKPSNRQAMLCGLILMSYAAYSAADFKSEDKGKFIGAHCILRREADLHRTLPGWLGDEVEYTLVQQETHVFNAVAAEDLSSVLRHTLGHDDVSSLAWQQEGTHSYCSLEQGYRIDMACGRIFQADHAMGMPYWIYQHAHYQDIMAGYYPTPHVMVGADRQLIYLIPTVKEQGVVLLEPRANHLNIAIASGKTKDEDIAQLRAVQQRYINRDKLTRELPAALRDEFTHWLQPEDDSGRKVHIKDRSDTVKYVWKPEYGLLYTYPDHKWRLVHWKDRSLLTAEQQKLFDALACFESPEYTLVFADHQPQQEQKQTITHIILPRYNLRFDVSTAHPPQTESYYLYSNEFQDYYLASEQVIESLSGFDNYLILRHCHLEQALPKTILLIPNLVLETKRHSYQTAFSFQNPGKQLPYTAPYFSYQQHHVDCIKGDSLGADLFLAYLYFFIAAEAIDPMTRMTGFETCAMLLTQAWKNEPYDETERTVFARWCKGINDTSLHRNAVGIRLKLYLLYRHSEYLRFLHPMPPGSVAEYGFLQQLLNNHCVGHYIRYRATMHHSCRLSEQETQALVKIETNFFGDQYSQLVRGDAAKVEIRQFEPHHNYGDHVLFFQKIEENHLSQIKFTDRLHQEKGRYEKRTHLASAITVYTDRYLLPNQVSCSDDIVSFIGLYQHLLKVPNRQYYQYLWAVLHGYGTGIIARHYFSLYDYQTFPVIIFCLINQTIGNVFGSSIGNDNRIVLSPQFWRAFDGLISQAEQRKGVLNLYYTNWPNNRLDTNIEPSALQLLPLVSTGVVDLPSASAPQPLPADILIGQTFIESIDATPEQLTFPLLAENFAQSYEKQFYDEMKQSWDKYSGNTERQYQLKANVTLKQLTTWLEEKLQQMLTTTALYRDWLYQQINYTPEQEKGYLVRLYRAIGYLPRLTMARLFLLLTDHDQEKVAWSTLQPFLDTNNQSSVQRILTTIDQYVRHLCLQNQVARVLRQLYQGRPINVVARDLLAKPQHPALEMGSTDTRMQEIICRSHSTWQLFELENDILCRDRQIELSAKMINNFAQALAVHNQNIQEKNNLSLFQLNMGEGKSSVILPLIILGLQREKGLLRINVLEPLLTITQQLLWARLGRFSYRRVYTLPFSREVNITIEDLERLKDNLAICQREGGILIVTPEHRLAMQLKWEELLLDVKLMREFSPGRFMWPRDIGFSTYLPTRARRATLTDRSLIDQSYVDQQKSSIEAALKDKRLAYLTEEGNVTNKALPDSARSFQQQLEAILPSSSVANSASLITQAYHVLRVSSEQRRNDIVIKLSLFRDIRAIVFVDVIDESDEILSFGKELNFTLGDRSPLPGGVFRWKIQELIFSSIFDDKELREQFKQGRAQGHVKYTDATDRSQITIQLLDEAFYEANIKPRLARTVVYSKIICDVLLAHNALFIFKSLDNVITFIKNEADVADAKKYIEELLSKPENEELANVIFALKGILSHKILFHVLSYRHRVNYGLDTLPSGELRKSIAIPFRAKDEPAVRSEFSHPDIMIGFTLLSYVYQGLSFQQLNQCLTRLYQTCREFSAVLTQWDPIFTGRENISTDAALGYANRLRSNRQAIFFYCNHFVFPNGTKQFTIKVSGNAETLVRHAVMQGFSGTEGRKMIMPLRTHSHNYDEQANGKMMHIVMRDKNKAVHPVDYDSSEQLLGHFLGYIKSNISSPTARCCVLIDAGALITGLSNKDVAKYLLSEIPHYAGEAVEFLGVTYFDETARQLSVLLRSGNTIALNQCQIANKHLFTYLDNARARGTDIKLYAVANAIVTIDQGMDKDSFMQAIMRLRQLNEGQSFSIWMHVSVAQKIRDVNETHNIENKHVLYWLSLNTIIYVKKQLRPHCLQARSAIVKYSALESQQAHIPENFSAIEQETLEQCVHPIDTRLSSFYSHLFESRQAHRYAEDRTGSGLIPELAFNFVKPQDKQDLEKIRGHFKSGYTAEDAIKVMTRIHLDSTGTTEATPNFEQDQEQEQQMEVIQSIVVPRPATRRPRQERAWSYASLFEADFFAKAQRQQIPGLRLVQLKDFTKNVHLQSGASATLALSELDLADDRIWLTENFLYAVDTSHREIIEYLRPVNLLILSRAPNGQHHWMIISGKEGNGIKHYLLGQAQNKPWPEHIMCFHLHDKWLDSERREVLSSFTGERYALAPEEERDYILLKLFNGDCEYLLQHHDRLRTILGGIDDQTTQEALNTILERRQWQWDSNKVGRYLKGFKFALIEQGYMTKNGFLTEQSTKLFEGDRGGFAVTNAHTGSFDDHITMAMTEQTKHAASNTEGRYIVSEINTDEAPGANIATLFGLSVKEATDLLLSNKQKLRSAWSDLPGDDPSLQRYLTERCQWSIASIGDDLSICYALAACCQCRVIIWQLTDKTIKQRTKAIDMVLSDNARRMDILVDNGRVRGLLSFVGYRDGYPEDDAKVLESERKVSLSIYHHHIEYQAIDGDVFGLSTALFKRLAETVIEASIFSSSRSKAHLMHYYVEGLLLIRNVQHVFVGSSLEKIINPYVSSEFMIDVNETNDLVSDLEDQQGMLPFGVKVQQTQEEISSLEKYDIKGRIEKIKIIIENLSEAASHDRKNRKKFPQEIVKLNQAVNRLMIGQASFDLADTAIDALEKQASRLKKELAASSGTTEDQLLILSEIRKTYEQAKKHDPCDRHSRLGSALERTKQTIKEKEQALLQEVEQEITKIDEENSKTLHGCRASVFNLTALGNRISRIFILFKDIATSQTTIDHLVSRESQQSAALDEHEKRISTYKEQDKQIKIILLKIEPLQYESTSADSDKIRIDLEKVVHLKAIDEIDSDRRYRGETDKIADLLSGVAAMIDNIIEAVAKAGNLLLSDDSISALYARSNRLDEDKTVTRQAIINTEALTLTEQQKALIVVSIQLLRPATQAKKDDAESWYPDLEALLKIDQDLFTQIEEQLNLLKPHDDASLAVADKLLSVAFIKNIMQSLQKLSDRQAEQEDLQRCMEEARKTLAVKHEDRQNLLADAAKLDGLYHQLEAMSMARAQLCYHLGLSSIIQIIVTFKQEQAQIFIAQGREKRSAAEEAVTQRIDAQIICCLRNEQSLLAASVDYFEKALILLSNNSALAHAHQDLAAQRKSQQEKLAAISEEIESRIATEDLLQQIEGLSQQLAASGEPSFVQLDKNVVTLEKFIGILNEISTKSCASHYETSTQAKRKEYDDCVRFTGKIFNERRAAHQASAKKTSLEDQAITSLASALSCVVQEIKLLRLESQDSQVLYRLEQEQQLLQTQIKQKRTNGIARCIEHASILVTKPGQIERLCSDLEDAFELAGDDVAAIGKVTVDCQALVRKISTDATIRSEKLLQASREATELTKKKNLLEEANQLLSIAAAVAEKCIALGIEVKEYSNIQWHMVMIASRMHDLVVGQLCEQIDSNLTIANRLISGNNFSDSKQVLTVVEADLSKAVSLIQKRETDNKRELSSERMLKLTTQQLDSKRRLISERSLELATQQLELANKQGLAHLPPERLLQDHMIFFELQQENAKKVAREMNQDDKVALAKEAGYQEEEIESMLTLGASSSVIRKLAASSVVSLQQSDDDSDDTIACIENLLDMGSKEAARASGHDIVLVIGNTGVGKSTTVNYLHGCHLEESFQQENDIEGIIQVSPDSGVQTLMPIGHSGQSRTFIPTIAYSETTGIYFCDCPGFFEQRGKEISIANAINISNTIKQAKTIKLLLLIDYNSACGDPRGIFLEKLAEFLLNFFGATEQGEITKYLDSLIVGITKAPISNKGRAINAKQVIANMDRSGKFIDELREKLHERRTVVVDPIDPRVDGYDRQAIITKITCDTKILQHTPKAMAFLKDDEKIILMKISNRARRTIIDSLTQRTLENIASELRKLKAIAIVEDQEINEGLREVSKCISGHFEEVARAYKTAYDKGDFELSKDHMEYLRCLTMQIFVFMPEMKKQFNMVVQIHRKAHEQKIAKAFVNRLIGFLEIADWSAAAEFAINNIYLLSQAQQHQITQHKGLQQQIMQLKTNMNWNKYVRLLVKTALAFVIIRPQQGNHDQSQSVYFLYTSEDWYEFDIISHQVSLLLSIYPNYQMENLLDELMAIDKSTQQIPLRQFHDSRAYKSLIGSPSSFFASESLTRSLLKKRYNERRQHNQEHAWSSTAPGDIQDVKNELHL